MRILCLAAAVMTVVLPSFPAERPVLRFDMGTENSPVAAGFVRVTPAAKYQPGRRYGWEGATGAAYDVARPAENPAWHQPSAQLIPRDLVVFNEHNELTRDGVGGNGDLVFRVDVPNGLYRVALTIGDLRRPVNSVEIHINDIRVARNVSARQFAGRGAADYQHPFPRKVRSTVAVEDGKIRIRLHGDDSDFRALFAEEYNKPAPPSYLVGRPNIGRKPAKLDLADWGASEHRPVPGEVRTTVWVFKDIGGPFTSHALNAVEIYPFVAPPLWWRERLQANSADAAVVEGARAFNAGSFRASELAFDRAKDPYARALGYLWLAGHPDYEEEVRLVPRARALLEGLASKRGEDLMFAEALENARRMDKAIYRFVHRADEQRTYNELMLISGEVSSMQPGDPTYPKGLIYAGRGLYMNIPHRWTFASGAGRQMFELLRQAGFRNNRFVRWYLDEHWEEHPPDWVYPDYTRAKAGVPRWAAEIYEGYNREVDLAEWWIRNRQQKDGSLGGGWGDDVEVLRSFGAFGSVCPDASPSIMQGVRKVADGAWMSGSIDTGAGYFAEVSDTEHSGEWTADTLVAMIRTDYGNPVYLERALLTGKLMRDLWMDRNEKGQFLMRSNFLGATGVGREGTENDSSINFRPASPARAVLWYNGLPALQKMFLDWADTWLAAALSTEKGKPRGIIPEEIGFARGELGGTNSPAWHSAEHRAGTVNYDWEGGAGYRDHTVDLLLFAYRTTRDRKYLEPMRLEAEFVERHCPKEVLASEEVKEGRINPRLWASLPAGSPEWVAAKLANWPRKWEAMRRVLFPEEFPEQSELWTLDEAAHQAASEVDGARKRWPHVTTECIATDRVYWPGMGNSFKMMTGYGIAGESAAVTYRGFGRDFAAVVLRVDAARLKVALYNMAPEQKEASVVPWLLDLGAEYSLEAGPDGDQDGRMDQVAETRRFTLEHRGQEVRVRFPARTTWIVDMRRTRAGATTRTLAPDLALSPEDIRFVAEYRRIDVTVHNVGSAAARGIRVLLYDGDVQIGSQTIPNIEAPHDLDAKTVRVGFGFVPRQKQHTLKAVVDPDGRIKEINESNNVAVAERATPLVPPKQHSSP